MSGSVYQGGELSPERIRQWGYDETITFTEQDEVALLSDFGLVSALLELASDSGCPRQNEALGIVCQFCREQVTRSGKQGGRALQIMLTHFSRRVEHLPGLWTGYVQRLILYTLYPQSLTKAEAYTVAHELLVGIVGRTGSVQETRSTKPGWWRFTLKSSFTEHVDICAESGAYQYSCGYSHRTVLNRKSV